MSLFSCFGRLKAPDRLSSISATGPRRHQRRWRSQLFLEPLEVRCVPTTITPTTFDDGGLGSGSLRDAVLEFNADTGTDDDTILLEAGTYALTLRNSGGHHETAGLTGDLNLTSASHCWILQGTGSSGDNATVIDASQLQDRVFDIVTPGTQVEFRDLIIQGGLAQDDGSDGALPGTTDALGGGILNNGGDVTLDNVVVQNNVARGGDAANYSGAPGHNARGGGFYSTGGALTIRGATVTSNQAMGGRGDAAARGTVGAGGSAAGGGLYAIGGPLDICNSTIANNHVAAGSGGDYRLSIIGGGPGGSAAGGGLYATGGSLDIANSRIGSNGATGGQGGDGGQTEFDQTAGGGNGGAGQGGGLYVSGGSLDLSSSTISNNQATGGTGGNYGGSGGDGAGGGIFVVPGSTVAVDQSTIASNQGTGGAAGFHGYGHGGVGEGGGFYNRGAVTVSNSTLSGNLTTFNGGGIYDSGTVRLTNVTLTANRANTGGGSFHGGGLFVYVLAPVPVLHNTLIAGNFRGATGTTRDDVHGALNSSGDYNLIGDGTGMTGLSDGVNGNQVGTAANPIDPLLGPLDNNGGPTLTHALLSGSPATDAGNNAYATDWDQRGEGFPRIVGIIDPGNPMIDIGAFEVQKDGSARATSLRAKPVRLDVAALIGTQQSQQLMSQSANETKPAMVGIDALFANDTREQSRTGFGRLAVRDAPTLFHTHKESRQDLTDAIGFNLFGVFSTD